MAHNTTKRLRKCNRYLPHQMEGKLHGLSLLGQTFNFNAFLPFRYGWVIVFASFFCNMIVDGIAYTFGIFLPKFVAYYGVGKGEVAWVSLIKYTLYTEYYNL